MKRVDQLEPLASFLFNFAGMDDAGAEKIIEFIELYRILGIKHAVLYDVENSTSKVVDVIKYYMDTGFLSKFNRVKTPSVNTLQKHEKIRTFAIF